MSSSISAILFIVLFQSEMEGPMVAPHSVGMHILAALTNIMANDL